MKWGNLGQATLVPRSQEGQRWEVSLHLPWILTAVEICYVALLPPSGPLPHVHYPQILFDSPSIIVSLSLVYRQRSKSA